MKEVSPELQAAFTNEILHEFASGLDEVLRKRIAAISGKVPSQTIERMKFEIIEASASDISANYRLYFQDSGRISEMKNIKGGRPISVQAILEWVRKGRTSLFRNVPGYKQGTEISQAKKEERIATAIAFAKAKGTRRRGKKLKERQWINKNFYGWYNRLVTDFINRQSEVLKQLVQEGFKEFENI